MNVLQAMRSLLIILLLDCLLCWLFASDEGLFFGFLDPIFFMGGFLAIGLLGFASIEANKG